MTTAQVKETERIANEVVQQNSKIYARETPLAQAKSIQGLRAIFDEVSLHMTCHVCTICIALF